MTITNDEKTALKDRIDGLDKNQFKQSVLLSCAYLKYIGNLRGKGCSGPELTKIIVKHYKAGPFQMDQNELKKTDNYVYRVMDVDMHNIRRAYPVIADCSRQPVVQSGTILASFNSLYGTPCKVLDS